MPTLKEQFWDPVAGFGVTVRTIRGSASQPGRAAMCGSRSEVKSFSMLNDGTPTGCWVGETVA